MTSALGGVENGEAKHMLDATETANKKAVGLTPSPRAALKAIGAIRTVVTVLLMNNVMIEVTK